MHIYILLIITVFILSFVNGFTDGVNSIASVVIKDIYSVKKAAVISGFFNVLGCFCFCIFYGKVTVWILDIVKTSGEDDKKMLAALSLSLISVSIFSIFCWWFKIATSESQGLIGAVFGACLFLGGAFSKNIFFDVFKEQAISIFLGIFLGLFLKRLFSRFNPKFNRERSLKCLMAIQSFLHGGQDGQKFYAIILAASVFKEGEVLKENFYLLLLTALFMGVGTFFCGRRIIDKISTISNLSEIDMLSCDIATVLCVFISTFKGVPISTTYVKVSSIYGTSLKANIKDKNKNAFFHMIIGWALTFPVCALIAFILCFIVI